MLKPILSHVCNQLHHKSCHTDDTIWIIIQHDYGHCAECTVVQIRPADPRIWLISLTSTSSSSWLWSNSDDWTVITLRALPSMVTSNISLAAGTSRNWQQNISHMKGNNCNATQHEMSICRYTRASQLRRMCSVQLFCDNSGFNWLISVITGLINTATRPVSTHWYCHAPAAEDELKRVFLNCKALI